MYIINIIQMEYINSGVPFVITSGDENIDKHNTISLNNLII